MSLDIINTRDGVMTRIHTSVRTTMAKLWTGKISSFKMEAYSFISETWNIVAVGEVGSIGAFDDILSIRRFDQATGSRYPGTFTGSLNESLTLAYLKSLTEMESYAADAITLGEHQVRGITIPDEYYVRFSEHRAE